MNLLAAARSLVDQASGTFTYSINPPEVDKLYTRLWTEVKTGR